MNLFQAIILGLIQGLTEFLPISSSAHLILTPWFLGWENHPLTLDIALHLATLFAVIIYFRKDWARLLWEGFLSVKERTLKGLIERRLFWYIIVASIPVIAVGMLAGKEAGTYFRNPVFIATMAGIFGLILYFSELAGKKNKPLAEITLQASLLVGLSQMFAIIPGVSRAGITMTAAMFLGLNRESSARFSFLLGAPIIFAASVYHIKDLLKINEFLPWPLFFGGFTTSFVTSMLAIHFLLRYIKKYPFTIFAVYRMALSVFILIMLFWRG